MTNCCRRSLASLTLLALLALLAAPPSSARDRDGLGGRRGGRGGGRNQRRRRGDVGAGTWVHESVSAEPLTFEAPDEPPPTDRARLLAGSEDYNHRAGDDDLLAGYAEEEFDTDDVDDYGGWGGHYLDDGDDYADAEAADPSHSFSSGDFVMEDEDGGYHFDDDFDEYDEGAHGGGGQFAMYDYDDVDVPYDSSNYAVDEIDNFAREDHDADFQEDEEEIGNGDDEPSEEDGGGFNDVGEPKVFEPIARRLRRRLDNPARGGGAGGDRHLARTDVRAQGLHNNSTSALQKSRRKLGCHNVKVQFKVDRYGRETTVTLYGNGRQILKSARDVGAYQTKTMQKCVNPGGYTLKLQDVDGICCGNGKGYYKMWVNGQLVISGGYFLGSKSHSIQIGKNWQASMNYREKEWLNAHNSRRRKYNGGRGYVAMRWSRSLASRAKSHANRLANNCKSGSLTHAHGIEEGENLAKNQGQGTWGSLYPADKIMRRWVEAELGWSYPKNAHMTQVVWRATQYVGCGEALKTYSNNHRCRVQVCRYVKAGNCAVRNGNWRAEAWEDDSSCGADCPPNEGCFI
ncbi:hypothetical protein ACHAW5_004537 [Stephanodiscus triporus]|uniref:SCP domain-containing protein n=1 Tax=Stephanodiscus triporus TaxID=2934178 RepID=A0ABD3PTX3_9STRA